MEKTAVKTAGKQLLMMLKLRRSSDKSLLCLFPDFLLKSMNTLTDSVHLGRDLVQALLQVGVLLLQAVVLLCLSCQ